MISTLASSLLAAGLIQFGLFGEMPFRLSLDLLPSYPDVLQQIIREFKQQIDFSHFERLLCTHNALPLGVGLSLDTGIPLVYSLGTTQLPVHDIVGAYDVGHPTLLLTHSWHDGSDIARLGEAGKRVGVNVNLAASIVSFQNYPNTDIRHISLINFSTLTSALAESHYLPVPQARAVQRWIETHATSPIKVHQSGDS